MTRMKTTSKSRGNSELLLSAQKKPDNTQERSKCKIFNRKKTKKTPISSSGIFRAGQKERRKREKSNKTKSSVNSAKRVHSYRGDKSSGIKVSSYEKRREADFSNLSQNQKKFLDPKVKFKDLASFRKDYSSSPRAKRSGEKLPLGHPLLSSVTPGVSGISFSGIHLGFPRTMKNREIKESKSNMNDSKGSRHSKCHSICNQNKSHSKLSSNALFLSKMKSKVQERLLERVEKESEPHYSSMEHISKKTQASHLKSKGIPFLQLDREPNSSKMLHLTLNNSKHTVAPLVQINNIMGDLKEPGSSKLSSTKFSRNERGPASSKKIRRSAKELKLGVGSCDSRSRIKSPSPDLLNPESERNKTHSLLKKLGEKYNKQKIAHYLSKNRVG